MNRAALRRLLAQEGLVRKAFDARAWLERARKTGDDVFVEYVQYVIDQGHLTPSASSVLKEFIDARGYGRQEYQRLADHMNFSGRR